MFCIFALDSCQRLHFYSWVNIVIWYSNSSLLTLQRLQTQTNPVIITVKSYLTAKGNLNKGIQCIFPMPVIRFRHTMTLSSYHTRSQSLKALKRLAIAFEHKTYFSMAMYNSSPTTVSILQSRWYVSPLKISNGQNSMTTKEWWLCLDKSNLLCIISRRYI